ncbi:neutrophil cytosolic factor 1-like [Branchiostoma floridae]|uniref:Neutrophil cytosolic factor 1-like n=1 Tax=Branchiostoma floridae TaxID=7739 RepID=A0A9J7MNY1_BRAFL|nr:neutrophil cytosolic factor 1-like [Branchiostoma floridae]
MLGRLQVQADMGGSSWSLRSDVSDSGRRLVAVQMVGVEKRYSPRRHHVYIVSELWSDGSRLVVYRSYRQFRALHKQLKEMFPVEAGQFRGEERVLPKFPNKPSSPGLGRKFSVGRFACVQKDLQEYCQDLLRLDSKIVLSPLFQGFFAPSDDDLRSSQNSEKRQKTVMIIPTEAAEPEQPRSPCDVEISAPLFDLDSYRAVADYKAVSKGELSLTAGEVCDVIHTTLSGWWLVENASCERGWVPASHLEADTPSPTPKPGTQSVGSPATQPGHETGSMSESGGEAPIQRYVTTRPYTATEDDELSFCVGAVLQVLQRTDDGWWQARYSGQDGFVPAMFLRPYNTPYVHMVAATSKLSMVNLLTAEKQQRSNNNSRKGSCSDVSWMSLLGVQLSPGKGSAGSDISSIGLTDEGVPEVKNSIERDTNRKGDNFERADILAKREFQPSSKFDLPKITISIADSAADCQAHSDTRQDTPNSPRIPPRPSEQEIIQRCSPLTQRRLLSTPSTATSDDDYTSVEGEALGAVWTGRQRKDSGLGIVNLSFEPCDYDHNEVCLDRGDNTFSSITSVQSAFSFSKSTCWLDQEKTQGEPSPNTVAATSNGREEGVKFVRNNRLWMTLKLKR